MRQSAGESEWMCEERKRGGHGCAYVTFRMTLAGHTGLLPHQFYCCPRGHDITQTHTHTHTLSISLNISFSLSPTSAPTQTYAEPLATWLYLAQHTRSLWLAVENQQHPPSSPASETLLGNREAVPLQATAAARFSSALIPILVSDKDKYNLMTMWECFNSIQYCVSWVTTQGGMTWCYTGLLGNTHRTKMSTHVYGYQILHVK